MLLELLLMEIISTTTRKESKDISGDLVDRDILVIV